MLIILSISLHPVQVYLQFFLILSEFYILSGKPDPPG